MQDAYITCASTVVECTNTSTLHIASAYVGQELGQSANAGNMRSVPKKIHRPVLNEGLKRRVS